MPVINRSRKTWIVSKVKKADTLLTRMVGWIGRSRIDPEAALWVKPCWGIHTFGMHFPVDVLFLARDGRVIEVVSNFPINRISPFVFRARSVLVVPAHSIKKSRTMVGDLIEITESVLPDAI
jgi:uncharacterized membrane protein (UPF0127 family)